MVISSDKRKRNKNLVGSRIAARRRDLRLTQVDLAKALGMNGFSWVSAAEQGHMTLPPDSWIPIASVLRLDIDEFLIHCWKSLHPEMYAAITDDMPEDEAVKWLRRSIKRRNTKKFVKARIEKAEMS